MGFVGSMLGSKSGAGFQAQGVNQQQLNTAYDQTQAGIKQQQDFVNALGQQGGLANQSSVFNQQQGLANQLQGVANGTGPNPALAQLNQQTGRNVANQAALMAGQRGAGQNVGLMARQAAQNGANLQQQAVGQGATLQAQQQLAAMQQLQGQQANMGNMANTQVGQQQTGLSNLNDAQLRQQQNLLGLQANVNSANAAIAGGNQKQQAGMMQGGMGAIGSAFQMIPKMIGGMGGGGDMSQGAADVGTPSSTPDIMSGGGEGIGDGLMNAAEGGEVPQKMADGGPAFDPLMSQTTPQATVSQIPVTPPIDHSTTAAGAGPISNVGQMFSSKEAPIKVTGGGSGAATVGGLAPGMETTTVDGKTTTQENAGYAEKKADEAYDAGRNAKTDREMGRMGQLVGTLFGGGGGGAGKMIGSAVPQLMRAIMGKAEGGAVPALVSPGEDYLSPKDVDKVKKGANPLSVGERIPGKPKVGGAVNSYSNDIIPKTLESGGIVLPRSVTQADDANAKAIAFVNAILSKKGQLPKKAKK